MQRSPRLDLPYILPSQAQKHVTHNEALDALDMLVQCAPLTRDLGEPPEDAAEGDIHIVGAEPSGDWADRAFHIAARRDGTWTFHAPQPGWLAWIVAEAEMVFWSGSAWQSVQETLSRLQNLVRLGIGTTADAENPFSAKLNKALWSALGDDEGGDGDLRYTLNKQAPAKVLSLLLQSGWSGRAEIGLVGDDDLAVKVSPDGSSWYEAIRIARETGRVAIARSGFLRDAMVSLLPDSGRFAGNAAKATTVSTFSFPSYMTVSNGTTTASGGKFLTNNTDYGGSAGTLESGVRTLVDKIRSPAHRRYGLEFFIAELTMGSGTTNSPVTYDSATYYLSLLATLGPMLPRMTFHMYVRTLDAPVVWFRQGGQKLVRDGTPYESHQRISPSDGWVSMTVQHEADPYQSVGYQPNLYALYAQSVGNRYQMACPALIGGITEVDVNAGVIAGINRWLP